MRVRMDFPFSSSHVLPNHPGRCRNLHGHNYVLQVQVSGKVDPHSGMVVDFFDLQHAVAERLVNHLDHRHLNDVMPNPTAEEILRYAWKKLVGGVSGLEELVLHETPDCCAIYRGEDEDAP